jgi:hypothetical protein
LTNIQCKEERIKLIVAGHENQIRNMDKTDVVNSVSAMVVICAKMYTGMQEDKMMTESIQECVRFIYKNFPMIGVQEIREAFSMAAANHWDGITLSSFYGQFTIGMLGDILSAYLKFRNKILSDVITLKEIKDMEIENAAKREEKNKNAIESVLQDLEDKLISMQSGEQIEWESWQDVPAFYAEIACTNGFIEDDKAFKAQIWEQSKQIAKHELIATAQDYSNLTAARQAKRKIMQNFEGTIDPAKRIYSKLLVWEYLKRLCL